MIFKGLKLARAELVEEQERRTESRSRSRSGTGSRSGSKVDWTMKDGLYEEMPEGATVRAILVLAILRLDTPSSGFLSVRFLQFPTVRPYYQTIATALDRWTRLTRLDWMTSMIR